MKNPIARFVIAGSLLAGGSLATAMEQSDNAANTVGDTANLEVTDQHAAEWLERMGNSLREENYQGIFTYIRGSTFDTVRIVHRFEDGVETERLFNLNGDVRELYRHGDEILLYRPKTEEPSNDENIVQIGPFTTAFSDRVLSAQNMYRLSMHGTDRIAGRSAVKVAVSPRYNDRYGYRLWLDEETGLMLQSHLVERGRVKEIFQFTTLTIGEPISDSAIASAIDGETVSHPLSLESNDVTEKPFWRVAWLPDGFRPVKAQGNRLHFSDGVATFSVFVERSDATALPDMATTVGGTVVITRRIQNTGPQVTVVGEVPVQTAQKVAESVEPVIY